MIKNPKNKRFWTEGNGKDFLDWAGISENELQGGYSTDWFYRYDEEMDALVNGWMKDGRFSTIMKSLHGQASESELPEDYTAFKAKLSLVPEWLDKDLLAEGCRLSERSGLVGLLVLRDFALLGGYYFANLTKPLVATGALEKGAVHRLYNTLGFWVDVSRSSPEASQIRLDACLRTRLIHSASRGMILGKFPDWEDDRYGIPINHADMIATHIAFTVYFLYGLERLNFKFSAREEAGIFHLWKYVTYLLGVPLELIPTHRREAVSFFYFWTQYQGEPDEDSLKLAEALLNENTAVNLLKLEVVKRNMGYIHKSISNFLIDPGVKNALGIPPVQFRQVIPNAIKLSNDFIPPGDQQRQQGDKQQRSVLSDYRTAIR
ncbi:oxygenase MpaB family protein [Bergeyella sp. RCAD1439]|uniref:oxygenase MpaB family protein n=1 Tax=Bergeyella anatis TaxID=3113737 RepID=UPI002E17DA96|nr:oxygenase MpaB family protein [Bergeyella sp. RCAD1439]